MISGEILQDLFTAFPVGMLNHNLEFIAFPRANTYFCIKDCNTYEDTVAKVLEWLSRAAYKTEPFRGQKANREFHEYHLRGINDFCGTTFTEDDMDEIYTYLGNAVNHKKTLAFIRSDFDLSVLTMKEESRC